MVPTFTVTPAPGALPDTPAPSEDSDSSTATATGSKSETETESSSAPIQEALLESNAPSNAQLLSELLISSDGLSEAWQDWSWSISTEYASTAQVQSGVSALAVTYDQAWGALYLHSNTPITRDDYDALRFWVHGGDAGGQKVRVVLADKNDRVHGGRRGS